MKFSFRFVLIIILECIVFCLYSMIWGDCSGIQDGIVLIALCLVFAFALFIHVIRNDKPNRLFIVNVLILPVLYVMCLTVAPPISSYAYRTYFFCEGDDQYTFTVYRFHRKFKVDHRYTDNREKELKNMHGTIEIEEDCMKLKLDTSGMRKEWMDSSLIDAMNYDVYLRNDTIFGFKGKKYKTTKL